MLVTFFHFLNPARHQIFPPMLLIFPWLWLSHQWSGRLSWWCLPSLSPHISNNDDHLYVDLFLFCHRPYTSTCAAKLKEFYVYEQIINTCLSLLHELHMSFPSFDWFLLLPGSNWQFRTDTLIYMCRFLTNVKNLPSKSRFFLGVYIMFDWWFAPCVHSWVVGFHSIGYVHVAFTTNGPTIQQRRYVQRHVIWMVLLSVVPPLEIKRVL